MPVVGPISQVEPLLVCEMKACAAAAVSSSKYVAGLAPIPACVKAAAARVVSPIVVLLIVPSVMFAQVIAGNGIAIASNGSSNYTVKTPPLLAIAIPLPAITCAGNFGIVAIFTRARGWTLMRTVGRAITSALRLRPAGPQG